MTAGEKIKMYRVLKDYTQKKLSELSGVSEISIRKYEAGDRKAKPEQLQKIAEALDLPVTVFLDIETAPLNIDTLGDFMSLFFKLEKNYGAELTYEADEDHIVNSESVCIRFKNPVIQDNLVSLAEQYNLVSALRKENGESLGTDNIIEHAKAQLLKSDLPVR